MNSLTLGRPGLEPRPLSWFAALCRRLRRARAVRRTRTAIAGLTDDQLRDIGLTPGDPVLGPDEYRRMWQRYLWGREDHTLPALPDRR